MALQLSEELSRTVWRSLCHIGITRVAARLVHLALNKHFDFCCLLEVVQLVFSDPPSRGFHEQFRVVVLVAKECVEG